MHDWKSYLGNKEHKRMFLVVFRSDVHFGFAWKIGCVEWNLCSPVTYVIYQSLKFIPDVEIEIFQ